MHRSIADAHQYVKWQAPSRKCGFSTRGQADRLPLIAAEVAQLNCDVYFAPGSELNLTEIKQATRDKPIVIVSNDYDPVATGHIANMVRPGGRITGVSQLQTELPAKRLSVPRSCSGRTPGICRSSSPT
jgi:hypothetical protein